MIRYPEGIEADCLGVPRHALEMLPTLTCGPFGHRQKQSNL